MPGRRAVKAAATMAGVALLAGGTAAAGTGGSASAVTPTSVTIRYLGWATVFSDATVDESRTSNGRTPRATTTGTGFYFVTFPAANPVTNFRHASVQVTTLDEFRVVCEVGTRHVDPLTHDYTVGVVCIRSETGAEANAAFSLQVLV